MRGAYASPAPCTAKEGDRLTPPPAKSCSSRLVSSTGDRDRWPAGAWLSGENPLEKQQNPLPDEPAPHCRGSPSPRSGSHSSACFNTIWGLRLQRGGLCLWVFSERKYIKKKKEEKDPNPKNLGSQLSCCDFRISCCARTQHGKILRKFLLKNKNNNGKPTAG